VDPEITVKTALSDDYIGKSSFYGRPEKPERVKL